MITVTEAARRALLACKPDDREQIGLRLLIVTEGG